MSFVPADPSVSAKIHFLLSAYTLQRAVPKSDTCLALEEAGVGRVNALPALFFALQDNRRNPPSGAHVIYVLLIDLGSQATAPVLCAPFNLNHLSQML